MLVGRVTSTTRARMIAMLAVARVTMMRFCLGVIGKSVAQSMTNDKWRMTNDE